MEPALSGENPTGKKAFIGMLCFAAFLFVAATGWTAFVIYELGYYDLVLGGPDGNFQVLWWLHFFLTVIGTFLYAGGLIIFRKRFALCSTRRVVVCSLITTMPLLIWNALADFCRNIIEPFWAMVALIVWLLFSGMILFPRRQRNEPTSQP
jgi:hypothetical protein